MGGTKHAIDKQFVQSQAEEQKQHPTFFAQCAEIGCSVFLSQNCLNFLVTSVYSVHVETQKCMSSS